jgi:DHA1 family bicyclomycin/chloramphenicol resistance-like MFS transporter
MARIPLSLIVILGSLSAFGPFATDMYLPAFPAITAGLGTEPAAVQRTLAAFFAGMGCGQLLYGPAADRWGRKLPLFLGLGIFTAASLGAAMADGIGWFTLMRLMQGLGGCAGVVVARAIARDLTEGPSMVRLMSQLMLVGGLAPIIAPSVGGLVLGGAGWRGIFLALAAYSALLIVVVALLLPESLPPERRRRDSPWQVTLTYWRLVSNRRFLGLALSGALPVAGMFAYIGGSPFVFMELHDISPQGYGLYFGANALGIMAVAQTNAAMIRRGVQPARALAVVQWAMAAAGAALLLVALTGLGGFPALVVTLFCYVAGVGAVMPLASSLAMVPHGGVAGSASALIGSLQFGIGAVAGWLVGALHDESALPMALGVALCGAAGVLARKALVPETSGSAR